MFHWMVESIFNANRGGGSNKDVGLVMGVPGAWMVVLRPLDCVLRTEDFRRALDQGRPILSNPRDQRVPERPGFWQSHR